MMGWLVRIEGEENDRRLLKRVVGAFYLLACIAGLSCIMPLKARNYVLGRLHQIKVNAIEIMSNRALDRGLEFDPHGYLIADALFTGDGHAQAMRFARNFRLLAILLDHLIENYPVCQTGGIGGSRCAEPFAIGTNRAGGLLVTLCRSLVGATGRQLCASTTRLGFEPIDSS